MMRANVGGTESILRAAGDAGVPRILYCSSVAALGSGPEGSIGDETRAHHGNFPSTYEESKWRAHATLHHVRSVKKVGNKGTVFQVRLKTTSSKYHSDAVAIHASD